MKKTWLVILAIVIALGFVAWYAFWPERIVVNRSVNEAFPGGQASSAQTLASGTFHSALHPTEGIATVYRLGDGSRVLHFTNFKTSNGPDVHFYMVAADDAKDHATVLHSDFIDLGLSPRDPERLPGQLISPTGKLLWMVDTAAAELVSHAHEKRSA